MRCKFDTKGMATIAGHGVIPLIILRDVACMPTAPTQDDKKFALCVDNNNLWCKLQTKESGGGAALNGQSFMGTVNKDVVNTCICNQLS